MEKKNKHTTKLKNKPFTQEQIKKIRKIWITYFLLATGAICGISWLGIRGLYDDVKDAAEKYVSFEIEKHFKEPTIKKMVENAASERTDEVLTKTFIAENNSYLKTAKQKLKDELNTAKQKLEDELNRAKEITEYAYTAKASLNELLSNLEKVKIEIDLIQKDAQSKANEITILSQRVYGFIETVTLAQMDNREKFCELKTLAENGSFPLSKQASIVYQDIIKKYYKPLPECRRYLWPQDYSEYDPTEITPAKLASIYPAVPSDNKASFVQYVHKVRFHQEDKNEFFVCVIKNSKNLRAVAYAGYFLIEENNLKFQPLEIDKLLGWYEKNKGKI